MPTPLPPGFITKKDACQTYNRSHRQLTRDLGAAMATRDEKTLANFKVWTEDGNVLDGTDVSTDIIADLRADGRNPMWYVRSEWMEKTFGRRGEPVPGLERDEPSDIEAPDEGPEPSAGAPAEIVLLLKEQIRKLEDDKKDLQEDKRTLRDELTRRNERERETNVLMQDLHKLLAHMQDRLLPEKASRNAPLELLTGASPIVDADSVTEQGIPRKPSRRRPGSRRGKPRQSEQPPKQPPSGPEAKSIWRRDLRDLLSFRRK